jgi:hypothetical protein
MAMQNEPSSLSEALLSELKVLSHTIEDDMARRSKARRVMADILKALEQNDVDLLARAVGSQSAQLAMTYPETVAVLDKLQFDLHRRQDDRMRDVASHLESYCRAEGINIKGSWPKFTLDHLLPVEFDRKANRSKVGAVSLQTLKWPAVRDALVAERRRVWQRPFDATQFRDALLQAYRQVERIKPNPVGWVALEDVYQVLKKSEEQAHPAWRKNGRLAAYYKDELGADLSLLWDAQACGRVNPPTIEFSAIRDSRRAFEVLQPDGSIGLYGFLRPREGS